MGSLALIVLIGFYFLFFTGNGGANPTAVSLRNLVNRQSQVITIIDEYSGEIKSSRLKSKLSEVTIILTSGSSNINKYIADNINEETPSKATVSAKPDSDLLQKIEDSIKVNNLDAKLQETVEQLLITIDSETATLVKKNSESESLVAVLNKVQSGNAEVYRRLKEDI